LAPNVGKSAQEKRPLVEAFNRFVGSATLTYVAKFSPYIFPA